MNIFHFFLIFNLKNEHFSFFTLKNEHHYEGRFHLNKSLTSIYITTK